MSRLVIVFFFLLFVIDESTARNVSSMERCRKLIKKMNGEGPYLGLITTIASEDEAFFSTASSFIPHPTHPYVDLSGRRFHIGKVVGRKVVYVRCGRGMINAAAATQQMLDLFDIIGIIHFGIAGNLNSSMAIGDVTIPAQFANTGLWDWMKNDGTLPLDNVTRLDIGSYSDPRRENRLGFIAYYSEQFYDSKKPNTVQDVFWFQTSKNWLQVASKLEGMVLEKCVNECLEHDPKVVVGLNGSTADFFVDNPEYREFVFQNFKVSSTDMESVAVVMTSLSNGFPVIVIRSLSDLAGVGEGNLIHLYGSLAARNAVKVVTQFIRML